MKESIFNQYVSKITKLYKLNDEELFTKCKKREIVDARQLLYYLCHKRSMKLITIERFMLKNGYTISHNSIIHGIKVMEEKLDEDRDYRSIVNDIDKEVFI